MKPLRAVLIGVATIAAIAAVASPGAAKAPGANGRVVFAKFLPGHQNGDTLLYTANPDGSDQKQLLPASSCCPAWSPDGRKIAAAALTPDKRITTAVVNPDGSDLEVKTIPDPTMNLGCSAWSPDGSRMACSGWDDVHKNRPRGIFTVRTSDWGDLRQVTTNPSGARGANDDAGDYSPDGKRIVFLRENPDPNADAIYVVSTDGSGLEKITSFPTPDCCTASWSPDGKWILYTSIGTLEEIHPDGTGLRPVTLKARCVRRSGPARLAGIRVYRLRCHRGRPRMDPNILYWVAFGPVWSPDGKKMLFSLFIYTSAKQGKRAVYTANANGSGVKPVTRPVVVKARQLDFAASTDWGPTAH